MSPSLVFFTPFLFEKHRYQWNHRQTCTILFCKLPLYPMYLVYQPQQVVFVESCARICTYLWRLSCKMFLWREDRMDQYFWWRIAGHTAQDWKIEDSLLIHLLVFYRNEKNCENFWKILNFFKFLEFLKSREKFSYNDPFVGWKIAFHWWNYWEFGIEKLFLTCIEIERKFPNDDRSLLLLERHIDFLKSSSDTKRS